MVHTELIPNFLQPIILMDFLSDTYDRSEVMLGGEGGDGGEGRDGGEGGIVDGSRREREEETSILALHGLFILIVDHNLDYPTFFPKLYRLLSTTIVHSSHVFHFLQLLHNFLKSKLIPSYMIFAFLKRLSRLSLLSPPPVVSLILRIIYNVMFYHPTSQVLVHHIDAQQTPGLSPLLLNAQLLNTDPYDFYQLDMKECHAQESSLWELYALQNYYIPSISALAKKFNFAITAKNLFYLPEVDSASFQYFFDNEMKKKVKQGIPLAYKEPEVLLSKQLYSVGWE
eukprot:TRINITY_DN5693_c0_g1_i1.p1 TRINITY_DN5693_c0_g1~~TRINITY_DN5693_c0_g1_i1.p1  ORF type:complete len:284 (-),score=74.31 TRINITY_DN5693_c0_g1_i1:115-966(-)